MRIGSKLIIGSVLSIVLANLCLCFILHRLLTNQTRDRLATLKVEKENEMVRELRGRIESAYSALEHLASQNLPDETKKAQCLKMLSRMGFGDHNYIWTHQLDPENLSFAHMLVHPAASLVNQDLTGLMDQSQFNAIYFKGAIYPKNHPKVKDIEEKEIFAAFNRVCMDQGEGKVTYYWPKVVQGKKSHEGYRKISYVKYFPKWGWVLGAGGYADHIHSLMEAEAGALKRSTQELFRNIILVIALVTLLAACLLSSQIRKVVLLPLASLKKAVKSIKEDKRKVIVNIQSEDQFGELARDFMDMANAIEQHLAALNRENMERKAAEEELHQLNASLEERVKTRTQELEKSQDLALQKIEEASRAQRSAEFMANEMNKINEKMEEALVEAQSATEVKSRFMANMSHEIRTPMNGVLGVCDLLMESNLSIEQKKYAEMIKVSGQTMLTLINHILDFSLIESRELMLETVDFDLGRLLENTMDILTGKIKDDAIELSFYLGPDLPLLLSGDPKRIKQVLMCLADNAIKFTEKGDITISVEKVKETATHSEICFKVSDTGIGIQRMNMDKLFESFTQGDGSATRRYGGAGLGLTIAKHLVELMGGTLYCDSQLGEGSVFWFHLKLEKQAREAPKPATLLEAVKHKRILVIDPNPVVLRILTQYLMAWGLETATAQNQDMALELLKISKKTGKPFDLVIMDNNIKDASAKQLSQRIRKTPGFERIKIILLTSFRSQASMGESQEAGFETSCMKPVKRSTLEQALLQAMTLEETQADLLALEADQYKNLRALVVDDNITNQKVAGAILRKLGILVDVASNGAKALDAFKRTRYDFILMDCQMPVMDGYKATQAIRWFEEESGMGSHVQIIALTANTMDGARERCLAAGMDDYLPKPVNKKSLQGIISRILVPVSGLQHTH